MKRCACLTRCAASSADSPGFSRARASGAAATSTFRTRVGESRGPKAEPEELMRIDLRARVRTKDGHDAGKDRDGDVVGAVEEVRFDPATGALLGFTVKAGASLERLFGGGKLAEISRDDILRIAEGEVRLAVDREEIVPKERETGTR